MDPKFQPDPAPDPAGPPPFNGEQLVTAARYFFKWYCREVQVPPDSVYSLNPGHFIQWLRHYDFAANREIKTFSLYDNRADQVTADVAAEIEGPIEAVAFVLRLGEASTGLAHLSGLWPHLVLEGRSTIHEVRSAQFIMVLQWMDDTVMPINMIAMARPDQPIKDAEVVQLLSTQGPPDGPPRPASGL